MVKATKEIKPHKGGRTETVRCRITPEVRKKIDEMKKKKGPKTSDADIIEELVISKE